MSKLAEDARVLERLIERSPRRMTADGAAYKVLIPARLLSSVTRIADALEELPRAVDRVEQDIRNVEASIRKGARRCDHRFKL